MPSRMPSKLAGRVVVVTGAGGGIGRAASLRFAFYGASVVAADLSLESAQATAEICQKEYGSGSAVACSVDVTSEESVQAMVQLSVERFGRLDCALNAGKRCPTKHCPTQHSTKRCPYKHEFVIPLQLESRVSALRCTLVQSSTLRR